MAPKASPRRPLVPLAALVLALYSSCLTPARGDDDAGPERVDRRVLRVDGRIQEVLTADLDGDGRQELWVLHVTGQGRQARRWGSLFWQGPGGQLSPRPVLKRELDAGEVAFDVYSETARPDRLLSLRAAGVYEHRFQPPPASRVDVRRLEGASLPHLAPSQEDVLAFEFARPWSGGGLELLIPAFPGPLLLRPGRPCSLRRLDVPPEARYRALDPFSGTPVADLVARYSFPQAVSADQDGDGQQELVFHSRERVFVADPGAAASAAEGKPCADVPVRPFDVAVVTDADNPTEPYLRVPRLTDLDGDGRVDLLVSLFRDAGFFEIEGRFMVFRGRRDGTFAPVADQVLQLDNGQYHLALLGDLDGDGRQELLLPTAKLGAFGVIRAVTSRKVAFNLNVFSLDDEGRYGAARTLRPGLKVVLSDRYDVSAVFLAEVTGDGVRDLLLGMDEGSVCLHSGRRAGDGWTYEPKARLCFDGDPFGAMRPVDLDGDGRQELLAYGRRGEAHGRLEVLFFKP